MRARLVWTLLLVPVLFAAQAIPPGASVAGTVRDAAGDPVPSANVTVLGTALGTPTDASGRFEIAGLDADTVQVRVTRVGYAARTETVSLRDGETVRLDVTLAAADTELVVRDARRREAMLDGVPVSRAAPPAMSPAPVSADAAPAGGLRGGRSESAGYHSDGVRVEGREAPDGGQRPQAGLLTAGDIDDGLNWSAFLAYSERAVNRGSSLRDLRLDDRLTLRVVGRDGQPVAGARVRIEPDGPERRAASRGLTTEAGTDGRLALFPRYDFGEGVRQLRITATAPGGGASETLTLDLRRLRGDTEHVVRLDARAERPQALDLAVVLDVTGSMGDELAFLTDEFEAIVAQATRQYPQADLRFALVAYRDRGDQFTVRRWDFTRDAAEMRRRLADLSAGGGGDMPEAVDEALDAMLDLDWRTGTAARVAFLVGDAPPHANKLPETLRAVREARARGLRVYPLAASGVDATAEHVFRTAAVLTQARYLWLTDDSGVGNPHAEPNVPCYQVSRVDDLMARVIASELAGRRVEADPQAVVRSLGSPVGGVCNAVAASVQQPEARRQRSELGYD